MEHWHEHCTAGHQDLLDRQVADLWIAFQHDFRRTLLITQQLRHYSAGEWWVVGGTRADFATHREGTEHAEAQASASVGNDHQRFNARKPNLSLSLGATVLTPALAAEPALVVHCAAGGCVIVAVLVV